MFSVSVIPPYHYLEMLMMWGWLRLVVTLSMGPGWMDGWMDGGREEEGVEGGMD